VTVLGIVINDGLRFVSDTTVPGEGALVLMVTTPVALTPPTTVAGLIENAVTVGIGRTASVWSIAAHPSVARAVAITGAETCVVLMLNET